MSSSSAVRWRTRGRPSGGRPLRLLTPNWQTCLPARRYEGGDPDGFASIPEVIRFLDDYAGAISAPVQTRTTVTAVQATHGGYDVVTTQGVWRCVSVVLASGACNRPVIPIATEGVPPSVATVTPMMYGGPDDLAERGVLVVGVSATGVQLADEIHRSGRPVTLAVGEHVRLPRQYRGRDIFWWMEATGVLDQRYDEVDDLVRARHVPSPQLIGTPQRATLDLNTLAARGVHIVGRLGAISHGVAQFSGFLAGTAERHLRPDPAKLGGPIPGSASGERPPRTASGKPADRASRARPRRRGAGSRASPRALWKAVDQAL